MHESPCNNIFHTFLLAFIYIYIIEIDPMETLEFIFHTVNQMETFSALLALYVANDEFTSKRATPVELSCCFLNIINKLFTSFEIHATTSSAFRMPTVMSSKRPRWKIDIEGKFIFSFIFVLFLTNFLTHYHSYFFSRFHLSNVFTCIIGNVL